MQFIFQYPCKFTNSIRKFHHNLCSICSIEIIFQLFPLGTIISNQGMIYQFTPERFLITVMLNEVKHLYRFFADAQRACSVTDGLYPSDLGRFLPQKCPRCTTKRPFCQKNMTPRSKIAAKVPEVLTFHCSRLLQGVSRRKTFCGKLVRRGGKLAESTCFLPRRMTNG